MIDRLLGVGGAIVVGAGIHPAETESVVNTNRHMWMDVISSTFDISGNDAMKNNHVANWLANISTNGEGDVLMFLFVCEGTQRKYQLPKT